MQVAVIQREWLTSDKRDDPLSMDAEREAKLLSAKKKLKLYRAAKQGSTSSGHRKSSSRSSIVLDQRRGSRRHSRTDSITVAPPVDVLAGRRQSWRAPLTPQPDKDALARRRSSYNHPVDPPPETTLHARRPSRHSRQVSVSTRRESMEIMSGIFSAHFDATLSPDLAEPEEDQEASRLKALRALEGNSQTIELPTPAQAGIPTTPNSAENLLNTRRSSWKDGAPVTPNFGNTGGTGQLDMLVEEDEEEDDTRRSIDKKRKSPKPSTDDSTARRPRPATLIFAPSRNLPHCVASSSPVTSEMTPSSLNSSVSNRTSVTAPSVHSPVTKSHPDDSPISTPLKSLTLANAVTTPNGARRSMSLTPSNLPSTPLGQKRLSLLSSPALCTSSPARNSVDSPSLALKRRSLTYRTTDSSPAETPEKSKTLTPKSAETSPLNGRLQSLQSDLDKSQGELAKLRDVNADLEMERDMLREDIDGWRQRCSTLEKTLEKERIRHEDERREAVVLREKVRKLGDRLAAGSAGSADEQHALTDAQAKLISEMRDQIFSLAGALEQERNLRMQLVNPVYTTPPMGHSAMMAPLSAPSHTSTFSTSKPGHISESSYGLPSSGNTTDTSMFDEDCKSSFSSAPPFSPYISSPGVAMVAKKDEPVLETLAEVDEEDTPIQEQDIREFIESKPGSRKSSSISSEESVDQSTKSHNRSNSFIRQWAFPRGPVTPINEKQSPRNDNSFFGIYTEEVLPALPVREELFEVPFSAEIFVDEEAASLHSQTPSLNFHVRRTSTSRPAAISPAYSRSSFGQSRNSWLSNSSFVSKSPSRLSLQSISSLFNYVGATTPAQLPHAAKLCGPIPFDSDEESLVSLSAQSSYSKPRQSVDKKEALRKLRRELDSRSVKLEGCVGCNGRLMDA